MLKFFSQLIFFVFILLSVACSELPKPFSQSSVLRKNPLIVLAGGGAIKVEIDPALPESLSKPLSENMIESLWEENVPASGAKNFSPRYLLKGELKILNSSLFEAEKIEIVWTLTELRKKKKHEFTYKMFGKRPGWLLLDKNPLKNLPANMGTDVVKHLYKEQGLEDTMSKLKVNSEPLILPNQITSAKKSLTRSSDNGDSLILTKEPEVFIARIVGAPGDGNNSLYKNMRRMLIIAGLNVVSKRGDSMFLLTGFVNKSPTYEGLNDVAITWLVTTNDGRIVGKSTQNNKILEGSLDQEWGQVATDVAQAGIASIVEIILRYLTLQNTKR